MSGATLLQLRDIHKTFGDVRALSGVRLDVRAGEVHALLGENGAGKSTLMHIAYGMLQPESGELLVRGKAQRFHSPRDARAAGIGMVHQHFTSIPALTVAENIALLTGWPVRPRELAARVRELTQRLGLPLDPAARAAALPVALLQRLEIVKALASDAQVLLLDEPTAVLAPAEAEELLQRARAFAEAGGAVVLITHKLEEALRAAGRVTVLRRGTVVLEGSAADFDAATLATAMIGTRDQAAEPVIAVAESNHPAVVRVSSLEVRRDQGSGLAVHGASLEIRGGEIVGVAAVEGNGQRELLRAIAGVLSPVGGIQEVAQPVSFVPENRTTEGLIPDFSLTENVVLGLGRAASWAKAIQLDWPAAQRRTETLITDFDVRTTGPDAPAASLSGGNQQKLILGRALARSPAVIVAENPTRGLDLHATRAIHDRLRDAAKAGVAVIFYSSDLDEVILLAHRVVVMHDGLLHEASAGATREEIGAMMLGASNVI